MRATLFFIFLLANSTISFAQKADTTITIREFEKVDSYNYYKLLKRYLLVSQRKLTSDVQLYRVLIVHESATCTDTLFFGFNYAFTSNGKMPNHDDFVGFDYSKNACNVTLQIDTTSALILANWQATMPFKANYLKRLKKSPITMKVDTLIEFIGQFNGAEIRFTFDADSSLKSCESIPDTLKTVREPLSKENNHVYFKKLNGKLVPKQIYFYMDPKFNDDGFSRRVFIELVE